MTELERQILIITKLGPLSPAEIEARLTITVTQTELRDTIWSLIHRQRLDLTPERKLQFVQ